MFFNLLKKMGMYTFIMIIFLIIMLQLDHSHWKGMTKENDKTIYNKLLNRFYFLTTTFSTAGYGDISPITTTGKILTMIIQFCVMISFVEIFISDN